MCPKTTFVALPACFSLPGAGFSDGGRVGTAVVGTARNDPGVVLADGLHPAGDTTQVGVDQRPDRLGVERELVVLLSILLLHSPYLLCSTNGSRRRLHNTVKACEVYTYLKKMSRG